MELCVLVLAIQLCYCSIFCCTDDDRADVMDLLQLYLYINTDIIMIIALIGNRI